MNRFVRQDGSLEQTIKNVVKNNFPAVDISGLSGFSVESFGKNSLLKLNGGINTIELVENNGTNSRRYMVWSTTRWGGSSIVR